MRRLLALACALAACTPDFDSPSRVHDLRVLAIRADPPEAIVDFAANSVQPVTVTALVVGMSAPLEATWQVCFPTDNGRCGTPAATLPQIDDEAPTQRTLEPDPALVAAAQQDDRLKGFDGIRLQLSLEVSAGDPNGPVWAQKLVVYSPPSTPDPNHNPAIESVELTQDGAPFAVFVPSDPPDDARPQCLPLGVDIGMWPHLGSGPAGAETYTTTDLAGNVVTLTESPRYSFFATDPAELDEDTGDEPLPGVVPPRGLVRITARQIGTGKAWIVVRDGRGGENWIEMPFEGKQACP
jgi:hypothetical protein